MEKIRYYREAAGTYLAVEESPFDGFNYACEVRTNADVERPMLAFDWADSDDMKQVLHNTTEVQFSELPAPWQKAFTDREMVNY